MRRTIAASAARDHFAAILDDAENGTVTVVLRHSRASAAVVPAADLEPFDVFRRIMRDLGATLELGEEDPDVIAAVKRSHAAIDRGEITWDDE